MRNLLIVLAVPLLVATAGMRPQGAIANVLLEGYVVDATSELPLEGVLVGVRSGLSSIRMTSIKTDLHGHFAIAVADSSIAMSFFSRGYERLGYPLAAVPRQPIRIVLRRAVPLRGALVDPHGSPAAKARVYLTPIQPGGLQVVLQAVTDAEGRYEIDGAGEIKTYLLEAAPPGCERQRLRTATGLALRAGGEVVDVVLPCR